MGTGVGSAADVLSSGKVPWVGKSDTFSFLTDYDTLRRHLDKPCCLWEAGALPGMGNSRALKHPRRRVSSPLFQLEIKQNNFFSKSSVWLNIPRGLCEDRDGNGCLLAPSPTALAQGSTPLWDLPQGPPPGSGGRGRSPFGSVLDNLDFRGGPDCQIWPEASSELCQVPSSKE